MIVSFTDSEMEDSKYLGDGVHECVISKLEHRNSKSGKPMVEAHFTDSAGKSTRDWFMLEGGGKYKLALLAIACGFSKDELKGGRFDTAMLGNKSVKVTRSVTGKTEDGKTLHENSYSPSSKQPNTGSDIPF